MTGLLSVFKLEFLRNTGWDVKGHRYEKWSNVEYMWNKLYGTRIIYKFDRDVYVRYHWKRSKQVYVVQSSVINSVDRLYLLAMRRFFEAIHT